MDDNLDKAKKDILNEADGILKRGKLMNENCVDLFQGDLSDDSPLHIWMDNPTEDDLPFVTVMVGNFSFGLPLFVLEDLARAFSIADATADKFYKDNAANIKEHECTHEHPEDEEDEE